MRRRTLWGQPPKLARNEAEGAVRRSKTRLLLSRTSRSLKQRRRRPIQQFLGPQLLQLFLHSAQRAFARKFRSPEFSSR